MRFIFQRVNSNCLVSSPILVGLLTFYCPITFFQILLLLLLLLLLFHSVNLLEILTHSHPFIKFPAFIGTENPFQCLPESICVHRTKLAQISPKLRTIPESICVHRTKLAQISPKLRTIFLSDLPSYCSSTEFYIYQVVFSL